MTNEKINQVKPTPTEEGISGSGSSFCSVAFVRQSDVTKKAFKDLFGCDPSRFEGVKIYVDGQGAGPLFASTLEGCGMNISSFMGTNNGIILFDD